MTGIQAQASSDSWELLKAVAEDMKLPLLEISHAAELTQMTGTISKDMLQTIEQGAHAALGLLDSYMLGLQLAEEQQTLELEPVALSSVLYDTAHSLERYAKPYGVIIESQVSSQNLVMAHQVGLRAALLNLGKVILKAQSPERKLPTIKLVVRSTASGISTGIYSDITPLSPVALRQASQLYGRARQPLIWLSDGSAAGIFIASSILKAMSGYLRTSHYRKQAGLAVILPPSHQLQLV